MTVLRVGRQVTIPPLMQVRTFAPRSAAAAEAYSLYYDGSGDYVDCGNDASIIGLNAANFTVDLYWRCPANPPVYLQQTLLTQGNYFSGTPVAGWGFWAYRDGWGANREYLYFACASSAGWMVTASIGPLAYDTWYYLRGRYEAKSVYLSVNAGTEGSSINWNDNVTSTANLQFGRQDPAQDPVYGQGHICYAHLWNTNQGTLSSVPTAPFAVDANTAARWIHADGTGATLTDDSGNGNHGTIANAAWDTTAPTGWTTS